MPREGLHAPCIIGVHVPFSPVLMCALAAAPPSFLQVIVGDEQEDSDDDDDEQAAAEANKAVNAASAGTTGGPPAIGGPLAVGTKARKATAAAQQAAVVQTTSIWTSLKKMFSMNKTQQLSMHGKVRCRRGSQGLLACSAPLDLLMNVNHSSRIRPTYSFLRAQRLNKSAFDSMYLLSPFFLWAALIVAIYAVSYAWLRGLAAPVTMVNVMGFIRVSLRPFSHAAASLMGWLCASCPPSPEASSLWLFHASFDGLCSSSTRSSVCPVLSSLPTSSAHKRTWPARQVVCQYLYAMTSLALRAGAISCYAVPPLEAVHELGTLLPPPRRHTGRSCCPSASLIWAQSGT